MTCPDSTSTISTTSPDAPGTGINVNAFETDCSDHFKLLATVQGGTGGTLNIYLQGYDGENWFDIAALPQLADGAAVRTYSVKFDRHSQPLLTNLNIVTIGLNGTPALAAGNVDVGDFGNQIRLVFVAGAGTTAGKAQSFTLLHFEDKLAEYQLADVTANGDRPAS